MTDQHRPSVTACIKAVLSTHCRMLWQMNTWLHPIKLLQEEHKEEAQAEQLFRQLMHSNCASQTGTKQ